MDDPTRPEFDPAMSHEAFERWYWPKAALTQICEQLQLSKAGSKAELRARIALHLEDPDATPPKLPRRPKDGFNWGKAELTSATVITPSVTFGPNVRGFFKREIGKAFVCHSDFMDWVRSNVGATLSDAIDAWHMLERRKDDPAFRREIAEHNNFLQYLRDFADTLPDHTLDEAKTCWDQKKIRPAHDGKVIFERTDFRFLK
ncbi:MAG: DUF6434 domain-containing protein [Pseudomonadota bacterium]